MIHLQDFTQRLFEGETIKLPTIKQTSSVDSMGGQMFKEAAEDALINAKRMPRKSRLR